MASEKKLSETDRQKLIDNLVTNSDVEIANLWTEDDRETLNEMSDERLYRMAQQKQDLIDQNAVVEAVRNEFDEDGLHVIQMPKFIANMSKKMKARMAKDEEDVEEEEDEEEVENQSPPPKTPATPDPVLQRKRPMTDAEWLSQAPAGIRRAVENAQRHELKEKQDLITTMVENVDSDQREAVINLLRAKTNDELRVLSALPRKIEPELEIDPIRNARPSYFGQATPYVPSRRGRDVNADDVLEVPVINWAEERNRERQRA